MSELDLHDTIVAISTPIGEGGIGIVKVSGKDAIKIVDRIFKSAKARSLSKARNYSTNYGWIINRRASCVVRRASKENAVRTTHYALRNIIDEVLVTVMRAPHTYTREDIVEINCHSGIVPLKNILDLVLSNGARLARPGEFTQRAFINGRIDLTQAEAVLDIVSSKTDMGLQLGLDQLRGRLSKEINVLRGLLLDILTQIEANIDFPDEDNSSLSYKEIKKMLKNLKSKIISILHNSNEGKILREGINVVICGKPNVGKSSLLNMLLREERAIVTPIAGTTRDVIEEFVDIKGVPLRFVDTAGIIEPKDIIEKEAISRSLRYLKEANLVLLIFDGSKKISNQDKQIIKLSGDKELIVVINKVDLPLKIEVNLLKKKFKKIIRLSATRNIGLGDLENEIIKKIWHGKIINTQSIIVSNARHIESLKKSEESIARSVDSLRQKLSWEFVALDVKLAIESLGEITGQTVSDEVLDRIFSEFCIGK